MQITEALLSEPVDIRRFIQQAVDHWPRLLAVHFTLHSAEGNIDERQIHAFRTSLYHQLNRYVAECCHTASPAAAVVLRWLWENTESTRIRCLLLISQDLMCSPGSGMTADDADSHLVALLQQACTTLTPEGHCTVACCYRVVRAATPEGAESFTAFRNACLSLARPVMAGIIR
ncbi:inovirus Gp2 family protein [Escherichia coli]|uniref:inovirus-type Gp2 protein n=1 Tax=Escherichia coli TaxID=562 RepID=UPI000F0A9974|nr:inovirus-type Gp2 protein [Escherichia coli]EFA4518123.1 inovirus Gp2 family protein [Escherichia coli]EFN9649527.1 inovirus Gp2 family protein [Escherichia coli]